MADFRALFGDDDSETEEFLGFDLDDIKEAEEKYVRQLNVLNDLDSDIEFSEMGSSDEEEIDSDDDTVLADIAKWSDHLRPIQIAEFIGPTTVMENNKRELDFFNLLFPEALLIEIATQTNEYAEKQFEAAPNKNWYPTNAEEIKALIGVQIVMGVLPAPAQDMYWFKDKLFHPSCIEMKFS
jgi:hypothetical protein